ncbi:endonuclease/exonuclease/phosphatase [Nemania sp. FL0916]|nr:endonuclease/exonuclease/phosphatase [Nemania sp. FL0916]
MRWPITFINLLTAAASAAALPQAMIAPSAKMADPLSLRATTFNIRYAASASTYEKPWSVRGPLVINTVSSLSTNATSTGSLAFIGMQEVLHSQLLDITKGLGSSWAYIGTGRDDGREAGEYCPIFYQPGKVTLVGSVQKWLSPTPDVPSYWPGAGSRRYVLVGIFEDSSSRKRFIVANTHLDNASGEARSEGVKIILSVLRDAQSRYGPNLPVVLTGDFNSEPGDGAYEAVVKDGYLADAYEETEEDGGQRSGPYETYTGFVPDEIPDVSGRIDFVWLGPTSEGTGPWQAKRYEVVDNNVGGVFMSDHRPVVADVSLKV